MKRGLIVILGLFLLLGNSPAWGDATIETTFKTSGFKGMGASEGTTTKRYQGVKSYESAATKFTGAILSRLAGGAENISITRVDKGVSWNIDPKNKTYTESPIEKFKEKEYPQQRGEKEKPTARITKSEFTVKKTGASETINGFPCEEYLISWLLEWENIETKAKSSSTMNMNLWTTPETGTIQKVQAEEQAFHKAYAQKLGISLSPEETKQLGMAAFAAMSGAPPEETEKGFIRLKNEMAKIKGYPIRSVMNWNVEGEKGTPAAREERPAEPPAESSGGISGILGGLTSRFLQKKTEERTAPAGGKEAPFFSSTMEVKSLNADSVSPELFEIPAGYAKK